MSVLPLVILPDDRLFLCSQEVVEFGQPERQLVGDMFATMYAEGGIGLAAVQVGVHKRIFVIDVSESCSGVVNSDARFVEGYNDCCGPTVVINPEILEESKEKVVMSEGCLSIPGQREMVDRPERIVLKYQDLNGEVQIMKACGLLARCIQHEIDHLNGVVFLKHISKLKRDIIMSKVKKAAK